MWELIKMWWTKKYCHHEWESYHRVRVFEDNSAKRPIETRETLICKKCGKIKQIVL